MALRLGVFGVTPRQPHGTHRLVGAATARAGHAADRYAEIAAAVTAGATHHGLHHLAADRAMRVEQRPLHAQQAGLGGVGVGDVAGLEVVGAAGHRGDGAGHPAAGTGFGAGDCHPSVSAQATQALGQGGQVEVGEAGGRVGHGEDSCTVDRRHA